MGVIIAIVNNKGGVGKTTVACNLAHALGLLGKRVLVADLDSQCNATALPIPKEDPPQPGLYELLRPDGPDPALEDYLLTTRYDNVFCLPNVPETASLEPQLILGAPESFFRLRRRIRDQARGRFDFTLIDTPPNLGTFVLCALITADFALIPIKAGSTFSVEGLLKAVRLIKRNAGAGKRQDLHFLRLLINQMDQRTLISRTLAAQITEAFREDQVFHTTIPVNTAFERAEAAGKILLRYQPGTTGAGAFRELAQELLDILSLAADSARRQAT